MFGKFRFRVSLLLLLLLLLGCRNPPPATATPTTVADSTPVVPGPDIDDERYLVDSRLRCPPQSHTPVPVGPTPTPHGPELPLDARVALLRTTVQILLLDPECPAALLHAGWSVGYELQYRKNFLEAEMTGDGVPEWLLLYTPDEKRPAGALTTGGELFIVRGGPAPEIVFEATIPLESDGSLMPPPGEPPTLLAGSDISGDGLSDLHVYFTSCAFSTGRCFTHFSLLSFHGGAHEPHSLLRGPGDAESLPYFEHEGGEPTIGDANGDGRPDLIFYTAPSEVVGTGPTRAMTVVFEGGDGFFFQRPPVLDPARYRYDRLVDGEMAWEGGDLHEAARAYADALHGEWPEFHSGEAGEAERDAVQRMAALRLVQLAPLVGGSTDEPLATMRAHWPDHPLTGFAAMLASRGEDAAWSCPALAATYGEEESESLFGLLADPAYAAEPFTIETKLCVPTHHPEGEPPPRRRALAEPYRYAPH